MVSEYDAFGPWIYEITDEHPLPRLFLPYFQDETEQPFSLLKVPRDIPRQKATPDMDLYDYVIGAYPSGVRFLHRTPSGGVEETRAGYGEIEALRLQQHFIKGLMTLYLPGGPASISFNASSMKVVKAFFRLVREHYTTGSADAHPPLVRPEGLGALYINLLNDLEAEGEAPWLCAFQPLVERKLGPFSKYLAPWVPASLHMLLPRELLVIQQEPLPGADWKYNYHHTYIPLAKTEGIAIPDSKDLTDCRIRLPHHEFSYPLQADNQDLRRFYERAGRA